MPATPTANLARDETGARARMIDDVAHDVVLDLAQANDLTVDTFRSTATISFTLATADDLQHPRDDDDPHGDDSHGDSSDAATSGHLATWLDLIAPRVVSITCNGHSVDPTTAHDGARIALDETCGLVMGANVVEVVADCAFSHTGEGMHRFTDPVDDRTYLYTQYEPSDARRVFANFEQPSLKGPFTFHVLAPTAWDVRSNTSGTPTRIDDTTSRWDFLPTLPIATYITAVVAGPYHRVDDLWQGTTSSGEPIEVPLAVLCRQSLAAALDVDEVVAITRQGLDFFHQVFDVAYPFGRYDQVFVPEYNLGAMENPGLVTFTESYVFQSAVTDAERERRAATILHEMAHMWFGDLVTMQWWDDLWLKESFADYMGTLGTATATRFTDAWTTFATKDKARAARQDQLPTTHPIVADIVDLEAATLNFDGITYSKGASVVRQLVAWVGREAFLAGANDYFEQHAWGNTTLADFLASLESTSGRDLGSWSHDWLETAGVSELRVEVEVGAADSDVPGSGDTTADDGGVVVTAARLIQSGIDPATGQTVTRPHRVAIGGYDLVDGRLVRTLRTEVDLIDVATSLDELVGRTRPALVLANDDDLTYAKVVLDPTSLATVRQSLSTIEDSLARALVWSALWNATRDARMPAAEFLDVVARHAPDEHHAGILANLHHQTREAIEQFLPASLRAQMGGRLHDVAVAAADRSDPSSDRQLAWTRLAISLAGDRTDWLRGQLDGSGVRDGLDIDTDLRWAVWTALAAAGAAHEDDLDAELTRLDTARTRRHRAGALAARPTAAAKDAAWADLVDRRDLSSEVVTAIATGWGRRDQRDLTERFVTPYLTGLSDVWATHSIEIARRLVVGLFPPARDIMAGQAPTTHPTVVAVDDWLDTHAGAPAALRRLVIEQRDHLVRSLTAQAVTPGSAAGAADPS